MMTEKQMATLRKNNEESRAYTRDAIKGALFILSKRKPYETITVTDIINKSGVSRSAFYRNYKSKEDVLFDVLDTLLKELSTTINKNLEHNLRAVISMVNENYDSLKILIDAGKEYHILDILDKRVSYGEDRYEAYIWNGLVYTIIIDMLKNRFNHDEDNMVFGIMKALRTVSDRILNYEGVFPDRISYLGEKENQ